MKSRTKAILAMIISALALALMQIYVAKTAARISTSEQLLFRATVTALISLISILKKGIHPIFGKRENLGLLFLRASIGTIPMYLMFFATATGNQGQIAVLTKLSPFFVILFAMIFQNEKLKAYETVAMIIAMTGAVVTVNPTFSGFSIQALAAFGSSVFGGLAYFIIGRLKGREQPEVIVFFFSVFLALVSAIGAIPSFVVPNRTEFIDLMLLSLCATVGQLALTYGYTQAKASEVSVYNYTGIPGAMVFGYLMLGQSVKLTTLIGSVLVIASGIINFAGVNRQD